MDDLNRERKLQQSAAGGELSKLQAEYLSLVHKNGEIEGACRGLEAEVAAMRAALPKEAADALAAAAAAAGGGGDADGQPNGVGGEGMEG